LRRKSQKYVHSIKTCATVADSLLQLERELLEAIPVWEQEKGRPFLVYGESMLQFLNDVATSSQQENKRKPASRGNSVPPRATTPNESNVPPPTKTGTVTPAVRTAATSQSVPNKRRKVAEPTRSSHTRQPSGSNGTRQTSNVRVPLGSHRGNGVTKASSSPSKPAGRTASGTQLHKPPSGGSMTRSGARSLGHGRTPSGPAASTTYTLKTRSLAGSTSSATSSGRYASSSTTAASTAQKKAARAKKESFRPRPSLDHLEATSLLIGVNTQPGKWGMVDCLQEEEED
jgi:hypothetical protein